VARKALLETDEVVCAIASGWTALATWVDPIARRPSRASIAIRRIG
jgi:hypothetical protein